MSEEIKLEHTVTNRGFSASEFNDYYGMRCRISESSLASTETIWLGQLPESVQVASHVAAKLGIPNPNNEPFVALGEEFKNYILPPMMLLSKDHAKMLVSSLQKFIETGRL